MFTHLKFARDCHPSDLDQVYTALETLRSGANTSSTQRPCYSKVKLEEPAYDMLQSFCMASAIFCA